MPDKKTHWIVLWAVVILMLALAGCTSKSVGETGSRGEDKIKVYTTIYPLYDFTRAVGGDKVEVVNLIPAGQEPHHWEPTPAVMKDLAKADLLIYNGAGMEAWLDKIIDAYPNLRTVDSSKGIELIAGDHHHSYDPHIWLDPLNAKQQVRNILAALVEADPGSRDYYQKNAQSYLAELDKLDQEYRQALRDVRVRKFIVSHASFGYLAKRYGLEQVAVRGMFAEAEPGPKTMKEIVDITRKLGIKHVFYESLVSPKVSEVIAREAGVDTLCLNPLGALTEEEMSAGKNYLSIMRENLNNLRLALR
ncbi:zinc transport system substrate-binding protein [Desulfohalotomaculum tongense]|uniref:metal ABC transporter substrate-binding protein n=1 Tax=Desulforadius tongensis TaxID=1216062 RepID=UPI001959B083|nr:metal ABC transporter substrate-binding protein [Desulforadius tongensis]MBM7854781.1 zinc transport system substrate-binding protein [Desulforadius tongensis]